MHKTKYYIGRDVLRLWYVRTPSGSFRGGFESWDDAFGWFLCRLGLWDCVKRIAGSLPASGG